MCEMKFKNLKRSYVNCVDHNNTSGNDPKNRNFFAELHDSFSCDDAITAKGNLDGIKRKQRSTSYEGRSSSQSPSTSDGKDAPVLVKQKTKRIPERR